MIRNESNGAREALDELDQYLADSVPPLLVADSVRALISHPSRFLAQHLVSWAATTGRKDPGDVGEPLAKALTRIYQLAQLKLLPKREMTIFLSQFGPILLDACPADARGKIRSVIAQLLE